MEFKSIIKFIIELAIQVIKFIWKHSAKIALIAIILYIVECFYPLKGFILAYSGRFGLYVGRFIVIVGLIGCVKFLYDLVTPKED